MLGQSDLPNWVKGLIIVLIVLVIAAIIGFIVWKVTSDNDDTSNPAPAPAPAPAPTSEPAPALYIPLGAVDVNMGAVPTAANPNVVYSNGQPIADQTKYASGGFKVSRSADGKSASINYPNWGLAIAPQFVLDAGDPTGKTYKGIVLGSPAWLQFRDASVIYRSATSAILDYATMDFGKIGWWFTLTKV